MQLSARGEAWSELALFRKETKQHETKEHFVKYPPFRHRVNGVCVKKKGKETILVPILFIAAYKNKNTAY